MIQNGIKRINTETAVHYACVTDARNALLCYLEETQLGRLVDSQIKVIHKRENGEQGRPNAGEALLTQYIIGAFVNLSHELIKNGNISANLFLQRML